MDHLCKNYGNEIRAIRRCFQDGYGFGQPALRSYIRRLNLPIDAMFLWTSLDKDRDKFVSMEEVCVRSAIILASFQQWCRRQSFLRSCAAVWDSPEAVEVARKRTGTFMQEGR